MRQLRSKRAAQNQWANLMTVEYHKTGTGCDTALRGHQYK